MANNAFTEPRVAVVGVALFGSFCLGIPPTNTAGFWQEVDQINSEWIEVPKVPAYTTYTRENS